MNKELEKYIKKEILTMRKISFILILGLLLSGCSKDDSVIGFAPAEPYEPNSGAELLDELNSHLPFKIADKNFICKYNSGSNTLTGWIITKTIEQKDIVKQELKNSPTLKVLQVELLTPEMRKIFKTQWKQSQTVGPPDK